MKKILLFFLMIVILTISVQSATLTDTTNLQAYYPLNETSGTTVHDQSGNGHDLTFSSSNMAWNSTGCIGDEGCLRGNGTGSAWDSSSWYAPLSSAGNYTIIGWYYSTDCSSAWKTYFGQKQALYLTNNNAANIWYAMMDQDANVDRVSVGCTTGQWTLSMLTWDGTSDTATMWSNCSNIGNITGNTGFYDDTNPFGIGGNWNDGYTSGLYSSIAVYSKVLTQSQCLQYMDDTNGTESSPPSDSCTYVDGNWEINLADNCNTTSPVTVDAGYNITVYGTGRWYINTNVTTEHLLNLSYDGQYIKMNTSDAYLKVTG